MSLNDTPISERVQIGFFGRTNVGKSSLVNAIAGQPVSVVSEVKGTTTDPVKKAMELLPLGPVLLIDTPGLEDDSTLGELRVQKTKEVVSRIHAAVIVTDVKKGMGAVEKELIALVQAQSIPYFVVYNKCDLLPENGSVGKPCDLPESRLVHGDKREEDREQKESKEQNCCVVSSRTGENIEELKRLLAHGIKPLSKERKLVSDLLESGDHVVLVVPIDEAAPKGRLILPQQQTIRDILDAGCSVSVCQPKQLSAMLQMLRIPPKLVITDSQVFHVVKEIVPKEISLTSFSILFARYKGNLERAAMGAKRLDCLKDGDKILISEGCTHRRQCGDIGTVKLPQWIREFTGKEVEFTFTSGEEFPENLTPYALVVHCGACMLNERQMKVRLQRAKEQGVSVTNYGILIAYMQGILERSVEILGLKI